MNARGRIAVAGATGRVGRHVVDVLRARGHDVVPISRSGGVDVVSGEGLAEALADVECVIDATSGASADEGEATRFFTSAARNLHEHGERAGVERMVIVSIIGTDRFTRGYNAAKATHERLALAGPVPTTVLRAAQFHEFVPVLMDWGRRGDVSFVPSMRTQLVAARTVAEVLADMATSPLGDPGAPVPEVAGPREESLVRVAALLAERRGDPFRVEGANDPSDPDRRLYEDGALLPGPDAILAGPTFEEWLGSQPTGSSAPPARSAA